MQAHRVFTIKLCIAYLIFESIMLLMLFDSMRLRTTTSESTHSSLWSKADLPIGPWKFLSLHARHPCGQRRVASQPAGCIFRNRFCSND